jgi:hypothetical protein
MLDRNYIKISCNKCGIHRSQAEYCPLTGDRYGDGWEVKCPCGGIFEEVSYRSGGACAENVIKRLNMWIKMHESTAGLELEPTGDADIWGWYFNQRGGSCNGS